jgi:hypothetical protein
VKRILARRNRYQFGQPKDDLVDGGAVACTDTCIQLIVKMAKDKNVSLNEVRRKSGAPKDGSRGMRPSEVLRALKAFGLDYAARGDLSARDILRITRNRGPVVIAELYWAHPQWKGYRYAGKTNKGWTRSASGKRIRVGFSEPLTKSGSNQWTFRGGHAVLLAWAKVAGLDDVDESVGGVRDPNHNSPSRPQRPKWDELTPHQINRMVRSIRSVYGSRLVYVPRKVVVRA